MVTFVCAVFLNIKAGYRLLEGVADPDEAATDLMRK